MAMISDSRAGDLPTAMTDLFVAGEGGAMVELVTAGNKSGTDVIVNFEIVLAAPNAGTDTVSNLTITPDDKKVTVTPGKLFFKQGDKIRGMSSAAGAASYFISAVGGYFA